MPNREASYPLGVGSDPRQPLQIEQNPRTVAYAEVTWDLITSWLKQAERGNTEKLADLSRRMLGDGHLAAQVETRKLAVATAKLAVEPVDADDPIDVKGAADAQSMLDALPMSRVKKDLADGIWVGWALCQIAWEARGTWLWPKDILWNHPRRFRFDWSFKPYIYDDGRAASDMDKLTPEQRAECRDLNVQGMPLEPYRWLVHMPRSFPDYPQMGGVCLKAIRAWWIKANAIRYQLAGAEMLGNGRTIGKQDPNADAATKAAFRSNLENWGATGILTVTPGAEVELVAPLAQGASSVWSTLIEECNREESKAVLGSTLASDNTGSGSRALGESQREATIDPRAEVDEDEIRFTIDRDLVQVFLELNAINYGRKPNVRTRSVWVEEDATIDELAVKTGLIKANQFLASRGLPPLENGGDAFVKLPEMGAPLGALPVPGDAASLPTAADGTKVEAVADTALNGAQVTSLAELLAQVSAGTLSPEAAILFIVSSFPSIPEERAKRMVDAQAAMAKPVAADPAAAPLAALPDIAVGSEWLDTSDDHTLKVTAVGNGRVYFTDADYVNEKGVEQPTRQHSYAEPTFRERCSLKSVTPPGGADAAAPLRESDESGGSSPHASALPSEAHGDLFALSEGDAQAALSVLGHPGLLTAQAMLDGVGPFEKLRTSLIDACGSASNEAALGAALKSWAKRKAPALSDHLYEVALHARMAGALFVAQYEVPEAFAKERALDDSRVPPFLALPFDEAIAAFERRRIVTPEEFEAMDEAARTEAFTATRLAHEALVERARALLLRTLQHGGTFEEFRAALATDEASFGVTPSSPWYLETVYRTNVQMAYGAGRLQLLTSPAVAAVRPYLERRTARDNRVRDTHAALDGARYPQSDPDLVRANSPPYLDGELQFNCRCVLVAVRG